MRPNPAADPRPRQVLSGSVLLQVHGGAEEVAAAFLGAAEGADAAAVAMGG